MHKKILFCLLILILNLSFSQNLDDKIATIADIQAKSIEKEFHKKYYESLIVEIHKDYQLNDSINEEIKTIFQEEILPFINSVRNSYKILFKQNLTEKEINHYYNFISNTTGKSIFDKSTFINSEVLYITQVKDVNFSISNYANRVKKLIDNYTNQTKVVEEKKSDAIDRPMNPPPQIEMPTKRRVDESSYFSGDRHNYIKGNIVDKHSELQIKTPELVIVHFSIEKDGSVDSVSVQTEHKKLQKIISKAVSDSPKWIPSERYGEKIQTQKIYYIIINSSDSEKSIDIYEKYIPFSEKIK